MLSALGPGRVPVVLSPGELGGAAVPGLLQPCRGAPGFFLESHQNPGVVHAPRHRQLGAATAAPVRARAGNGHQGRVARGASSLMG